MCFFYSGSNNCDSSPCLNGGNCTDLGNNFQCQCPKGFVGPTCAEPKDLCKTISCLNGGTCLSSNDSFACLCPTGFAGTSCEKGITLASCVVYSVNILCCISKVNQTTYKKSILFLALYLCSFGDEINCNFIFILATKNSAS